MLTSYTNHIFLAVSSIDKQMFGKKLNLPFHTPESLTVCESVTLTLFHPSHKVYYDNFLFIYTALPLYLSCIFCTFIYE